MFPIKFEARMEQINRYRKRMEKALAMAGKEKTKVSISFWRPLNLFSILSNRVIRSTLKILAIWGRRERVDVCVDPTPAYCKMRSKTEAETTKKSKVFHTDRK